jgi:o-succinylbenzoate synthase
VTPLKGQLEEVKGPLCGSIVSGAAGLQTRHSLVLRLEDAAGLCGFGEASPLPGYSPDSLAQARRELSRICAQGVELGPEVPGVFWVEAALAALRVKSPAARFAVETALLDWLGKRRGLPVHALLARAPKHGALHIARFVPHREAGQWVDWVRTHAEPEATVKLKVGLAFEAELCALRDLRASFPDLQIRLDANRQLRPAQVLAAFDELRGLRLELFEEPVASEQWAEVLSLDLPFALDESLRSQLPWRDWVAVDSISALVLKPTVLGGILACWRLAEHARSHGLPCVVSHCFDGPVARAAMAELALALDSSLSPGLDAHPALELWPRHRIAAIRGREIRPHAQAGLGLSFEEALDA